MYPLAAAIAPSVTTANEPDPMFSFFKRKPKDTPVTPTPAEEAATDTDTATTAPAPLAPKPIDTGAVRTPDIPAAAPVAPQVEDIADTETIEADIVAVETPAET